LLEVRRKSSAPGGGFRRPARHDAERKQSSIWQGVRKPQPATTDATAFMRTDRGFNDLCLVASTQRVRGSTMTR